MVEHLEPEQQVVVLVENIGGIKPMAKMQLRLPPLLLLANVHRDEA
ncbi:MAG: hypothetical protein OJJ21_24165 [Ferrovibrio sp.]|nr:hypothetical protein [Ferrovibrio sp.]MCW0236713.1 hypothetical protein [Ferrovibrio sp.]